MSPKLSILHSPQIAIPHKVVRQLWHLGGHWTISRAPQPEVVTLGEKILPLKVPNLIQVSPSPLKSPALWRSPGCSPEAEQFLRKAVKGCDLAPHCSPPPFQGRAGPHETKTIRGNPFDLGQSKKWLIWTFLMMSYLGGPPPEFSNKVISTYTSIPALVASRWSPELGSEIMTGLQVTLITATHWTNTGFTLAITLPQRETPRRFPI